MEEAKIKILIVDDIEAHRRRFQRILAAQEDMEVVGQAATGQEAIVFARTTHPDTEDPDVVVQGIRTAFNSISPIRGDIAASIRNEFKRIKETEHSLLYVLSVLPTLTYSEQQVLKLLCQHKNKREIAESRVVEFSTVKKQVNSILKKFGKEYTVEVTEALKQLNIIDLLR